MKKNEQNTVENSQPKAEVTEATAEAVKLLTSVSLKVYTKGGNKVYSFLKHARKYVRDAAKAKTPKTAEALNAAFDSVFAEAQ